MSVDSICGIISVSALGLLIIISGIVFLFCALFEKKDKIIKNQKVEIENLKNENEFLVKKYNELKLENVNLKLGKLEVSISNSFKSCISKKKRGK